MLWCQLAMKLKWNLNSSLSGTCARFHLLALNKIDQLEIKLQSFYPISSGPCQIDFKVLKSFIAQEHLEEGMISKCRNRRKDLVPNGKVFPQFQVKYLKHSKFWPEL